MAQQITFTIEKKEDGTFANTNALNKHLQSLESGRWSISIKRYRKQRSDKQNAFYWSNFIPSEVDCFKEFWGETYTLEQIHEWNKVNFFGEQQVIEATGEVVRIPESSSAQTTVEFEEKLERCRQWFRQNFSWELPFPLQQTEMNY
jgi:hypothetical protein